MVGVDRVEHAEPDVLARLGWGARRYGALLVVAVVLAVAVSLAGPGRAPARSYDAAALVVATSLEIDALQLPRTADAVFKGGNVADFVASQLPDAGAAHRLIPKVIRAEPMNDSIVIRVIGRSRQPVMAADLANTAAFALVSELNALGPSVGRFVLQDRARPPLSRARTSSVAGPVVLGVLSGGALGLGLLGLLLLVRRPVVSGREASAVVAAPLLVSLGLPRRRRRVPLEAITGLGLLARHLSGVPTRSYAIVSTGADTRPRLEVMRLVAEVLGRRQPVCLAVAPAEHRALTAATGPLPNVRVVDDWLRSLEGHGSDCGCGLECRSSSFPLLSNESAVLFGLSAKHFDAPQLIPVGSRVVLLVTQGASRTQVETAARQFDDGDVRGVVFIERARRLRRRRRRRRAGGDSGGASQDRAPADRDRVESGRPGHQPGDRPVVEFDDLGYLDDLGDGPVSAHAPGDRAQAREGRAPASNGSRPDPGETTPASGHHAEAVGTGVSLRRPLGTAVLPFTGMAVDVVKELGGSSPPCPACTAPARAMRLLLENRYRLYRCPTCRSQFLLAITDEPDESRYWAHKRYKFDVYGADDVKTDYDERYRVVLDTVVRQTGPVGSVVDFGCGSGNFLSFAERKGVEATGVDLDATAVEAARDRGLRAYTPGELDAHLPDHSADMVTLWDVIEHIPEPGAFLSGVLQKARPGGIVIIETPDATFPLRPVVRFLHHVSGGRSRLVRRMYYWEHKVYFSVEGLRRLLRANGCEVVSVLKLTSPQAKMSHLFEMSAKSGRLGARMINRSWPMLEAMTRKVGAGNKIVLIARVFPGSGA